MSAFAVSVLLYKRDRLLGKTSLCSHLVHGKPQRFPPFPQKAETFSQILARKPSSSTVRGLCEGKACGSF